MKLRTLLTVIAITACSGDKTGAAETPSANDNKGAGAGGKATAAPADKRTQRGPEHAVFSLVDNRLLAHVYSDGGLLLPAGSAGFVKYLRYRKTSMPFELGVERDGMKVARINGSSASVLVPLSLDQTGPQTVRVRAYNAEARRMTARVNGKDVQTVELPQGWTTAEVAVPADRLKAPGENDLTLFVSKGSPMEIAWIQVGGAAAPAELPAVYDPKSKALSLAGSTSLAYYVMVPKGGMVVGDVVGDASCKVAVRAQPQSGKPITGTLAGRGDAIKLAPLDGKVVRLELSASGCANAGLAAASLTVPGAAAKLELGAKPKYVVFWIMDSLRADRIPTFTPGARPETPFFDELAKSSTFFLNTYVQGNESRVSHASIWSALYPVKHDMLSAKAKLDTKWKTIDEVADAAGLFTSGVSGNGYVALKWGFGTAWDKFRNHIHEGGGLTGADILGKALETVQDKVGTPFFLYMGTIDTHVSWRAKEPWIGKYDPKPYEGRFKTVASGGDMGKVAAGSIKINDRDKERIRAIYDSNVSYQDDLLRQLFDKLKEWGIDGETMVIVTADHGDEQWEVGRVGHGGSLRESLVRVPLVIHYPPMFPAAKIEEGAEVIDIVPTLADALGVKADGEWQGESLVPLANGIGVGYPRMAMASQYEGAHSARMGSWKLRASGGNKPELYDMAADPGETKDVVDEQPYARRFVADALWTLRAHNARWNKSRWGNAANVTAQFAADLGE